ncbi:MAG: alpha/beta fold hydrolase [Woeseiaceae bacterium]
MSRKSLVTCSFVLMTQLLTAAAAAADGDFVRLVAPLDEPEFYCLDIAGWGDHLQLDDPLQTHTCKARGGDDQMFHFDDGRLKVSRYDRCVQVAGSGDATLAGAAVIAKPCSKNTLQDLLLDDDGRIHVGQTSYCLAAGHESTEASGPSHLWRTLTVENCDTAPAHLSTWQVGLNSRDESTDATVSPTASIRGLEAKFINADGIKTRYYDEGSGEPLLLIHGGPWEGTSSANDWSLNIAGLAKVFRVLALDRLGNGMTDNPGRAREVDFSIAGQIEHIADFIKALDVGPVNIVAHSEGGIALYLAVERPDLVKSLVLVSSNIAAPDVGEDGTDNALAVCPWEVNGKEIGPWMDELVCRYRRLSHDPSHVDDEFIAALKLMNLQSKVQWTRFYRDGGAGEPFRSQFDNWRESMHEKIRDDGKLTIPVLLIWARHDPTHPLERSMALYDILAPRNPSVQTLMINNAGHYSFREKPGEFNFAVIRFVKAWIALGEISQ